LEGFAVSFGYKVYFTERARNRVVCWDPDRGDSEVVAGEPKDGAADQKLKSPYGLAMDSAGCLLIADKRNSRLCRLRNGRLEKVQTRDGDGHRRSRFTERVDNPENPTGVFVEKGGTLLVAYSDDFTIYRVRADGTLQLVLGVPPNRHALFEGYFETVKADKLPQTPLHMPTGVVEASDGTIYFIERGYQAVREYKLGGDLKSVFMRGQDLGPVQPLPKKLSRFGFWPRYPSGLALDARENLYVADFVYGCVFMADLGSGDVTTISTGAGSKPAAICFGPDGTLWVLDLGLAQVKGYRKSSRGAWQAAEATLKTESDPAALSCAALGGAGIVCGQ
jgi:sugar lactone lactonase YvrE